MQHANQFIKLVTDAKLRVAELTPQQVRSELTDNDVVLVDVREDSEWQQGGIEHAVHLGKGVIERDIERMLPDKNTKIILYCSGGFRSVLAADSIKKMGYTNVYSMQGGLKSWLDNK